MWSGNNSDQWGMNQAMTYMNMPHEQVDWASLAQQWIKMKEVAPQNEKDEGGEAPMEIAKDEAPIVAPPRTNEWSDTTGASVAAWGATGGWNWDQAGAWMQWAGTATTPDMAAAPGYTTAPSYTSVPAPEQAPVVPPAPVYSYNQPAPPARSVDSYSRGYWSGNSQNEGITRSQSWESNSSRRKSAPPPPPPVQESVPELDAAKRRALPAWIREGLEKMEREKMKKAEQERLQKLRTDETLGSTFATLNDVVGVANGNDPSPPKKSKFESDSEDEDGVGSGGTYDKAVSEMTPPPRRSRFDQSEPTLLPPPKIKYRTKEQILQAVMTDVRKILTQILMDVTSEEIENAVEETNRLFKKKAPAATFRKTPALASLTGKLGLGIYESDSGSESEPEKVTNERDSDQELQEKIDKLKRHFVKVEEDIQKEAAELEEKEKSQLVKNVQPLVQSQVTSQVSELPATEETKVSKVEDQVQLNREGSSISKNVKGSSVPEKGKEEVKNNQADGGGSGKDARSKGKSLRRSSIEKKKTNKKSSSNLHSKSASSKSSTSSSSSSTSSSSSSSSSEDDSSSDDESSSSRRKQKPLPPSRHSDRRRATSRYESRSVSRSKSRSKGRSRSRDRSYSHRQHHRHHHHNSTTRAPSSSSRPSDSRRRHIDNRKRRRSPSSSSSGSSKYRKSSRRR